MMRLVRIAVAALIAVLAVAACGGDDGGSTTDTPSPATTAPGGAGGGGEASISIENFQFGTSLPVKPGATVTVTNKDGATHNVVSDDGTSFKTPDLGKDESATFTAPSTPGNYKFSCSLHSSMSGIGTLVVQA
jgi:plastocyanin